MVIPLLKQFKTIEIEFDAILLLCQETVDCIIKINSMLRMLQVIISTDKCSPCHALSYSTFKAINHVMIPLGQIRTLRIRDVRNLFKRML